MWLEWHAQLICCLLHLLGTLARVLELSCLNSRIHAHLMTIVFAWMFTCLTWLTSRSFEGITTLAWCWSQLAWLVLELNLFGCFDGFYNELHFGLLEGLNFVLFWHKLLEWIHARVQEMWTFCLFHLELKLVDSLDCALKEGCRTLSKMHPKSLKLF